MGIFGLIMLLLLVVFTFNSNKERFREIKGDVFWVFLLGISIGIVSILILFSYNVTPLDVYRGKTELVIRRDKENNIIDSLVIFKE